MTSRSEQRRKTLNKISWPNPKPVKKQRKDRIKMYNFSCERAKSKLGPSGYVSPERQAQLQVEFHAVAFIRAVLKSDPGNKSAEWMLAKFTGELRKYLDD